MQEDAARDSHSAKWWSRHKSTDRRCGRVLRSAGRICNRRDPGAMGRSSVDKPDGYQREATAPGETSHAKPGIVPDSVDKRPFGPGARSANGETLFAVITPYLENCKRANVDFLPNHEVGWGSTEHSVPRAGPIWANQFACCFVRSVGFRVFAIQTMSETGRCRQVSTATAEAPLAAAFIMRLVARFDGVAGLLLERVGRAGRQLHTLVTLRVTLLPKLTSSAIRLAEAEEGKEVEA